MKNMKSSHSYSSTGSNFKLLLSSCARRVGGIALFIAALLALASGANAQGVFDFGATAPTPGAHDISQLTSGTATGVPGINYYVDGNNPGQTFTMGTGYQLTNLFIREVSGSAGGGMPQLSAYTLRIYQVSGTAATLLTTYVTTNTMTFVQGDWIQFTGLTNVLNGNNTYAYALNRNTGGWWMPAVSSSNPYSAGAVARFPTASGTLTFSSTAGYDAAFDLGLSILPLAAGATTFSPASPVYVGTQVTVSGPVDFGVGPYTYNWQVSTDGGATFSNLPTGNGNATYSLNTTGQGSTTNYYQLIVTDSESSPVTITNMAAALFVSSTAIAPFLQTNTTITPPAVLLGGSTTMSAAFGGAPNSYQWQYSATNDGTGVINISGATATSFVLANAQYANAGYYRLFVTNSAGVTNSSFALFTVLKPMVITDFGATDPVQGAYDIAQLSPIGNTGNPGMNYYADNGNPPGQTFTTGSDPGGYSLASVYIKSGTINGGISAGNPWTLRLYSLTNSLTGTATLIATYTNNNTAPALGLGTWIKWFGNFINVLSPNTVYGYSIRARSASGAGGGFLQMGNASGNPYSGGRAALFPTATGGINASNATVNNVDATFMVNLALAGYPAVQNVSMSPTNGSTVFAGQPVTLDVAAIGSNIGYVWQTNGGGGFSALPNPNTPHYSLDTSTFAPGTYQINVLVTNSFGTDTSSSLTLTVVPAVIQTVNISPANNSSNNPVYAGTAVTLSATVQGNNLTYYWQTDGGGGGSLTNIPGANTTNYTFDTSAMTAGTYQYDLLVSNVTGTVTSSQLTLNLVAASGPVVVSGATLNPAVVIVGNNSQVSASFHGSQPITYQWQHAGTNIPGATSTSFTITGAQFTDAGDYALIASNNPPGLGPTTASSAVAVLYVVPPAQNNTANATIFDGGTSPYVGPYDIAQLTYDATPFPPGPPGLNYFVDQGIPPGQTFTTSNSPPTPAGYPLNYAYLKHNPNGTGAGNGTAQAYTIRVYQMLDATNAQLLTSYVTANTTTIASGDWVLVAGLTNVLKTNASYAISLGRNTSGWWELDFHVSNPDAYLGGQAASLPVLGGTATVVNDPLGNFYDAAFVAGMTPPGPPVVVIDTTITPSTVYHLQGPVTMKATFAGSLPIYYHWQFTDTNNVTKLIPGATNTTYTIAVADYTNAGTYSLLASNSLSSGTNVSSTPVTLTVSPPPASFVMNFSWPTYSGAGVIGSGAAWNQINVSSGALMTNGVAAINEHNTSMVLDDGTTNMPIRFDIYDYPGSFANGTGIALLDGWLLLQGQAVTNHFPMTFSNCISGVYNLVLYGANGLYASSRSVFTVNGVSQTNTSPGDASFVNNGNYCVFYNIPVTNGVLSASWSQSSGNEAAFNGAQLQMAFNYENPQIFIAVQPASRTNLTGTLAGFSVAAEAPGQLFYQWRSNSVPISGATNSTYSAYTGTPGVWSYDVVVTNSTGLSATSTVATLTVNNPNYLIWRGYTPAWDLSSGNWSNLLTSADHVVFTPGDIVVLDDTATSYSPVLSNSLTPTTVTVSNATQNYLISSSGGSLGGSMNLIKVANGTLTISNNNNYSGGTTVNGGTLALAVGGAAGAIFGNLTINTGATVSLTAVDALGYGGSSVTPVNIIGGTLDDATGGNEAFITIFNLTGGTMSSSGGGAYNFDGASGVGINSLASSTVSTISGPVTLRSSPVVFSTAQGTVSSNVDLNVSGAIGGGGNALTKSGAGTLLLSGVNTYNGLTIVGNGTLLVSGTLPGAVTVNSGAVLGGSGTVAGVATIASGGTLGAAPGITTLTLNSSPVLSGTVVAEINRNGGSPLADQIAVVGNPVTYGGSLVVSNVGAALQGGDAFTLFSATSHNGSFTSITGSPGPGLVYSFANGVLRVVAANPTNITTSVSGNQLTLSWPADHTGWRLQSQTNAPGVGLGTNWVNVVGASTTNQVTITINPANGSVFFRLIYP
jgi:autotransporter-associated beta strand protein